ncbi:N-acetylmuramoyl-L-alanine amidase [Methylobacterium sp. PvP062]|uniref:N-acetylmuramoyl-L-alanine amidase n=2 Tax=Methylobacterium radiotolerans TaxID=31998 RepID=B1LUI4_METRJ|nr:MULTISPECIES: N-acetylmuramoyl-L-alanine amidase [Methylobacterium]MCX7331609.1 N-acetylmuramoyl-L-alanine amidase [Hyphomicrobiales bacterium]GAN47984.1 negative regulator of beta-lactamase expression [Methylobacterium sp. ME121]ACB24002.1 N-acetylmuramyl-L-alanine amidase, negative regulator of AmpC, AmpD [Methylobacterium radiotolerans JCM 2831]KTS07476.1 N-acetylmuramoyl-L-alanine amidase [Methylobacterium radiotolerans]KTS47218.1 N-acetylmuramoyl-L-alanine amidase [Methylobacterium rad
MSLAPDSPLARRVAPSPNHGARRAGPLDMLILHYTGMDSGAAALARLRDPLSEVSAHYLVFEDGGTVQMVPEARRAWHAGAGAWKGETDVNSRSIGIEIVNPGHAGGLPPYPEAQVEAVIALARDILGRWPIPPERVLAHSDVAPERKEDPGEIFPWDRLAAAGVGHHVPPARLQDGRFLARGDAGQPVEALQAMFALYGYDLPVTGTFDARTRAVVTAFQRHFRPARVDGVADASTITTLRDLIAALPAS